MSARDQTRAVEFSFRPLIDDDLPMLHGWLNEPGIVRWWEGDDVSWEGVVGDYGSEREPEPVDHWIAFTDDDGDVGWISCSPAAAWPEEFERWRALGIDDTAAGIDYLIADPERRGRGIGARMIDDFVRQIVFGEHPTWTQACADPDLDNVASWRALEKAGFRFVGLVPGPDDGAGPVRAWRLMARDRP